ncbi:hypothetical protein Cflav_PD5379 [Pedosphaera parvula Ellin514]|uniref:Uncharacterized protein n=1 Tax=Pedosphaera parvula (strain Ellin514) TaxID=320771 RepID=B9XB59_PEDPL|nr:hypothetical protein Cflav_PD5379 [Pedosphaera parvula Ellin514]
MGWAWILWAVIVAAIFVTLLIQGSRSRSGRNPGGDQPSDAGRNDDYREP